MPTKTIYLSPKDLNDAYRLQREYLDNLGHDTSPYAIDEVNHYKNSNTFELQAALNNAPSSSEIYAAGAAVTALTPLTGLGAVILAPLVSGFTIYAEWDNTKTKEKMFHQISEYNMKYIQNGDKKYKDDPEWRRYKNNFIEKQTAANKFTPLHLNQLTTASLSGLASESNESKSAILKLEIQAKEMDKKLLQAEQESGKTREEILSELGSLSNDMAKIIESYEKTSKQLNDHQVQLELMNNSFTELSIGYAGLNSMVNDMYQSYLEEKDEAIRKKYAQFIDAQWGHLQTTTNFIHELADIIGDKSIIKAAGYAKIFSDNARPIFQAFKIDTDPLIVNLSKYLTNAASIANVGMAIIFVAKLVFFKKKNEENFESVVIKYLQQISQQINDLQNQMNEHFARVNDKLEEIYQTIVLGFRDVLQELLATQIYMANRFDRIEADLFNISHKLDAAINALWLRPLTRTLHAIENDRVLRAIDDEKFNEQCDELMVWLRGEVSNSLSTGEFLAEPALRADKNNIHILKDILKTQDIVHLFGFLQKISERKYSVKMTESSDLFNPSIWFKAAHSYLKLNNNQHYKKYRLTLTSHTQGLMELAKQTILERKKIHEALLSFWQFVDQDETVNDNDLLAEIVAFIKTVETQSDLTSATIGKHIQTIQDFEKELLNYIDKLMRFSEERDKQRKELRYINETGKAILKIYGDIRWNKQLFDEVIARYKAHVGKLVDAYGTAIKYFTGEALKNNQLETEATKKTLADLTDLDKVSVKNLNTNNWATTIQIDNNHYKHGAKKNSKTRWNELCANWNAACSNQIQAFFVTYTDLLTRQIEMVKTDMPINNFLRLQMGDGHVILLPLSIIHLNLSEKFNFRTIQPLIIAQRIGAGEFSYELTATNGLSSSSCQFIVNVFFTLQDDKTKYPVFKATLGSNGNRNAHLDHAEQFSVFGPGDYDGTMAIAYAKQTEHTIIKMQLIHNWLNAKGTCEYDQKIDFLNDYVDKACQSQFTNLYKLTVEKQLANVKQDTLQKEVAVIEYMQITSEIECNYQLLNILANLAGFTNEDRELIKKLCNEEWINTQVKSAQSTQSLQNILKTHVSALPNAENKGSSLPLLTTVIDRVNNYFTSESKLIQKQRRLNFNNILQVGIEGIINSTQAIINDSSTLTLTGAHLSDRFEPSYDGVLDELYNHLFYSSDANVNNRFYKVERESFLIDELLEVLKPKDDNKEYYLERYAIDQLSFDNIAELTRSQSIEVLKKVSQLQPQIFTNSIRTEATLRLFFSSIVWPPVKSEDQNEFDGLQSQIAAVLKSYLEFSKSLASQQIKLDTPIMGLLLGFLIRELILNSKFIETPPSLLLTEEFITAIYHKNHSDYQAWLKLQSHGASKAQLANLITDTINLIYQRVFPYFNLARCLQYCESYLDNKNVSMGILSLKLVLENRNLVEGANHLPVMVWMPKYDGNNDHQLLFKVHSPTRVPKHIYWDPQFSYEYDWLIEAPAYRQQKIAPKIEYHQQVRNERLLKAARSGNIREITLALGDKADIEALDGEQKTAYCLLAENGHYQALKLLSDKGANELYRTPIILFQDRPKLIRDALEMFQTNLHQSDLSALMLAAREGHLETLKLIKTTPESLNKAMYRCNHMGISAMLMAAAMGRIAIIREYLTITDEYSGQNNLIADIALAFNYRDIFELVLSKLATFKYKIIYPKNQKEIELLYAALMLKNHHYLRYIYQNIENKSQPAGFFNSYLSYFYPVAKTEDSAAECINQLTIQETSYGTITLLMFAAIQDDEQSVQFLLAQKNINTNVRSSDSLSALTVALLNDNAIAFKVLFEAKVIFDKNSLLSIYARLINLLAKPDNLNIPTTKVLHYLYYFGHFGYHTITHTDLLFAACEYGNIHMLHALIGYGINLELTNHDGKTINDLEQNAEKQKILDYLNRKDINIQSKKIYVLEPPMETFNYQQGMITNLVTLADQRVVFRIDFSRIVKVLNLRTKSCDFSFDLHGEIKKQLNIANLDTVISTHANALQLLIVDNKVITICDVAITGAQPKKMLNVITVWNLANGSCEKVIRDDYTISRENITHLLLIAPGTIACAFNCGFKLLTKQYTFGQSAIYDRSTIDNVHGFAAPVALADGRIIAAISGKDHQNANSRCVAWNSKTSLYENLFEVQGYVDQQILLKDNRLLTAAYYKEEDKYITKYQIWNLSTKQAEFSFIDINGFWTGVLFTLPNDRIVTLMGNKIRIWNMQGTCEQSFDVVNTCTSIAVTNDNKVIMGDNAACIRIWQLPKLFREQKAPVLQIEAVSNAQSVSTIGFMPAPKKNQLANIGSASATMVNGPAK